MRQARPDDAEKLTRIAQAAYGKYVPRMVKAPAPMSYDYLAWIREGNTYVLEHFGEVAAMITLLPKDDHLMMRNLAVLPAFQGRRLGHALIDFAEAEAKRRNLPPTRSFRKQCRSTNRAASLKRIVPRSTDIRSSICRERSPDSVLGKHRRSDEASV